jgi:hypothetical protein
VRKLVSVVKLPLTLLFNLSLSTGFFSTVWKESFVDPIFKSGEKLDISCFRGISIFSVIQKLFEKMICDEITPIIRPQIYVLQLHEGSIVTNLVEFFSFVIDNIKNGRQVDGVYTDFSKAGPSTD